MNIVYKLNGKKVSREDFAAGSAPRFNDMVESGTPPACMTDAVFLEGRCNGNQFERTPEIGDFYRREAEAAGVSTTGKVYVAGLAEYPGDPKAWVAGRGDAERVLRERGWGAQGAVTTPVTSVAEPDQGYRVADDLVAAEVQKELGEADARDVDVPALTEQVREKLSPNWKE